jgi:hypothetical protein
MLRSGSEEASSYTLSPCPMTAFSLHTPTNAASCSRARHQTRSALLAARERASVVCSRPGGGKESVPWSWLAGRASTCRRVRRWSTCPRTCFRRPTSTARSRAAAMHHCVSTTCAVCESVTRRTATYAILVPGALISVAGSKGHYALALPSVVRPLSLVSVALPRRQRAVAVALVLPPLAIVGVAVAGGVGALAVPHVLYPVPHVL